MNAFFRFIKDKKFIKSERTRRLIKISSLSLLVVVFLFGVLTGSLMAYSYEKIDKARENVITSINAWSNFDLTSARDSLLTSEQSLQSLQNVIKWTKPFSRMPFFGHRVYAANIMVDSSLNALNSYGDVIDLTEDLYLYKNTPYDELKNKDD